MEKACLLVLLAAASVGAYYPQQYYFDERCNGLALHVTHTMRLRLTHYTGSQLNRNWNCALSLSANSATNRLMFYFRDLDTTYSSSCRVNRLDIQDTNGNYLTGPTGVCGFTTPSTVYTTSGNSAVIIFKTDGSYQTGDFDILVTEWHSAVNASQCPSASDFLCRNGRCIWSGLTCDGYNNCGDNSDELHGCSLAGAVIAGIVLSVIFFCGFVFVILLVFRRRRRSYVRIETQRPGYSTVTTTTTAYPPPQGSYPPPQGSYPPPQGSYPPPQGAYPYEQKPTYQN